MGVDFSIGFPYHVGVNAARYLFHSFPIMFTQECSILSQIRQELEDAASTTAAAERALSVGWTKGMATEIKALDARLTQIVALRRELGESGFIWTP